jgi:hypothetical protein
MRGKPFVLSVGEQAAWGPLELTDYGFDLRNHNFANSTTNPCP